MIRIFPRLKPQVWGNEELGKMFGSREKIGEVWLVSGHPLLVTEMEGGLDLNEDMESLIGKKLPRFPLLIKLISASEWLSVQVHPDDEKARELEGEPWGKTEAWYFLEDGTVALGEDPSEVLKALKNGNWNLALKKIRVGRGTFVFLPAGTVHALGPGGLLLEVQQASDVTYRIYDWGRPRETHLEKAAKVMKPCKLKELLFEGSDRFECEYFTVEIMKDGEADGFCILIALKEGKLNGKRVKRFETFLVPKDSKVRIDTNVFCVKLGKFFERWDGS